MNEVLVCSKEDGYGLINCAGHCKHLLSAPQPLQIFGDKFNDEWLPKAITMCHDSLHGPCASRHMQKERHSIATAGLQTLSSLEENAQETYELCKQEAAKEFQIAMPSRNKYPSVLPARR